MPNYQTHSESSSESADLPTTLAAHRGETVVVKYGGNAMTSDTLMAAVADDIAALRTAGINPVVVHGGGPAISAALKAAGIESEFIQGQRKTCEKSIVIVARVLTGPVNRSVVELLRARDVDARGMNGRSGPGGRLIEVRKHFRQMEIDGRLTKVDLGYVGEVTAVDAAYLRDCLGDGIVPVIAPIGVGADDHDYNINADILAGAVAAALKADHLIYLTDIDGIRENPSDSATRIGRISADDARGLLGNVIQGGMIPKVESLLGAIDNGLKQGHIVDGRKPGVLTAAVTQSAAAGTTLHA